MAKTHAGDDLGNHLPHHSGFDVCGDGTYFFAPEDHWLQSVASIAIIPVICVAFIGGGMGIALAMGKLKLRCPECDKNANVIGGNKKSLYLDCPKCGDVEMGIGRFRNRWSVLVLEEPEDS